MTSDLPAHVQSNIESICKLGCERVNEIIELLEAGETVAEVSELDKDQQRVVLHELKTIMAVYDQDQS
jgi:sulfopyruvate decarboxylase TPP-binding subunit